MTPGTQAAPDRRRDDATGAACVAAAVVALATFLMDATMVPPLACLGVAAVLMRVRTKLARILSRALVLVAVASLMISTVGMVSQLPGIGR